jgi:hypothetical protein
VITKPGETLSGIPKGAGRLFSNVTTAITSTKDPSQDSAAQELLLVGAFKRDYATRYDADPYSSNPILQEELEKIGKAAAFGSWTASAAMIPISAVVSSVITGTSLAKSFNNVLKAEPPTRIRVINEAPSRWTTECGPRTPTRSARDSRPATGRPASTAGSSCG